MFRVLPLFLMLLLAFKLDAQNYFDHWAFGTNVHIDFTSGTPSVSCNTSIIPQRQQLFGAIP
jgi:hypothetical protein